MIIKSLLDTDIYKYFMMQLAYHQFPSALVEYKFKCRTPDIDLFSHMEEIQRQVNMLGSLMLTTEEIGYLHGLDIFKDDFLEYLSDFMLEPKDVTISPGDGLDIDIVVYGTWTETILFETLILSIVNEVYFKKHNTLDNYIVGMQRLDRKIDLIEDSHSSRNPFKFSDFGARRRFSSEWQNHVVKRLRDTPGFQGTSNVFLAKKHDIPVIGTMAHELLMGFQQLSPNLSDFQVDALNAWINEYKGKLGIALSDVMGIDAFLADFDGRLARMYDGVRHDSGCPYEFGRKMKNHYMELGIDPRSKRLVFSDGLTIAKALDLRNEFGESFMCMFGVGTALTCDLGPRPIQIVMKMTMCNGKPVAKVSDSHGKQSCEDEGHILKIQGLIERKIKHGT